MSASTFFPIPGLYYVTTVLVRIGATDTYSSGTSSIVASFLDPSILIAKEATRYGQLLRMMPATEIALFGASLAALLVRRAAPDRVVATIAAGVPIAAAIVLNNASPLYLIHALPALVLPLAPLFTLGFGSGGPRVSLRELKAPALIAFAVATCAVCAGSSAATVRRIQVMSSQDVPASDDVRRVRAAVDPACTIAADGALYVPYLADYRRFLSTRETEVRLGMLSYGTTSEADYWQIKRPDAVFAPNPSPGLTAYIKDRALTEDAPGLWLAPGGCRKP